MAKKMDLISLIASIVTIESSGRNFLGHLFKRFRRYEIKKKIWDPNNPVLTAMLEECRSKGMSFLDMRIKTDEEISECVRKFIQSERYDKKLSNVDLQTLENHIKTVLGEFNSYLEGLLDDGQKILHKEIKHGHEKIEGKIDASTREIKEMIGESSGENRWDFLIRLLNDETCPIDAFKTNVFEKCDGFFEKIVRLFPSVECDCLKKYKILLIDSCSNVDKEEASIFILKTLSEKFEEYVNRLNGINGLYYTADFLDCWKETQIIIKSTESTAKYVGKIVDLIVERLNRGYKWENENALSEYVDYFFCFLDDFEIKKLLTPYINIFIDDQRGFCSPYDKNVKFKNKEISRKVVEKAKTIPSAKIDVVEPFLKNYIEKKKWSDETIYETKERLWKKYSSQIIDLGVDQVTFMNL